MNRTTRLKKPQIPELDTLYQFDDLGGRPKYGGVEMTSATDIPSFEEIQRHVDGAITAEAAARSAADDDLEEAIDAVEGGLEDEIAAREAADQAEATARAAADQAETTARTSADNNLQTQIDAIVASSDVKDIVGTYAELQAYDTSTLGDNDIIKVLQDETHQNETTYYRWVLADEEFSLIGEEGPYYTKAATDALLNNKADKATTYTKTETDAALALKADKATTYTKTEVDTALAGKQNTLTFDSTPTASSTNPVTSEGIKAYVDALPTGGIKELTTADYNYPTNNPSCIAVWLLEPGIYAVNSSLLVQPTVSAGANSYEGIIAVSKTRGSVIKNILLLGESIQNPARFSSVRGDTGVANVSQKFVLSQEDIKENLTTSAGLSGTYALGAYQGKVLNDRIGDLGTLATTAKTSTVAAINELVESGASVSYYSNSELESLWEGGV